MNSRERMALAMQLQQPDRVPVMCQLALGHYIPARGGLWQAMIVCGQLLCKSPEKGLRRQRASASEFSSAAVVMINLLAITALSRAHGEG